MAERDPRNVLDEIKVDFSKKDTGYPLKEMGRGMMGATVSACILFRMVLILEEMKKVYLLCQIFDLYVTAGKSSY